MLVWWMYPQILISFSPALPSLNLFHQLSCFFSLIQNKKTGRPRRIHRSWPDNVGLLHAWCPLDTERLVSPIPGKISYSSILTFLPSNLHDHHKQNSLWTLVRLEFKPAAPRSEPAFTLLRHSSWGYACMSLAGRVMIEALNSCWLIFRFCIQTNYNCWNLLYIWRQFTRACSLDERINNRTSPSWFPFFVVSACPAIPLPFLFDCYKKIDTRISRRLPHALSALHHATALDRWDRISWGTCILDAAPVYRASASLLSLSLISILSLSLLSILSLSYSLPLLSRSLDTIFCCQAKYIQQPSTTLNNLLLPLHRASSSSQGSFLLTGFLFYSTVVTSSIGCYGWFGCFWNFVLETLIYSTLDLVLGFAPT